MGVERDVTCWYLHRQMLLREIAQLEAQLGQVDTSLASVHSVASEASTDDSAGKIRFQLVRTREKLLSLGPCPKPMMG